MARDFWIDESDPPYPAIRHISHPNFEERFCTVLSLTAARQQIKEKCRIERQHWLAVMHHQVDQGVDSIIREAIEARRTE